MADLAEFDLTGRNAAVTGGGMGIGAGIAAALRRAGAHVVLIDKDMEAASRTAKALNSGGEAVRAVYADIRNPDECEAAIATSREALGSLDVLVNNAGIYPVRSLAEVTPELFDSVVRTNLLSVLYTSRAAARIMGEKPTGGSIVNIASLEGIKPSMLGLSMYGASKGGVVSLTKHLALELAPMKIRVNAIAPGAVVTEGSGKMTETSNMTEEERQQMLTAFEAKVPLGRLGQPNDLGGAAIFLASRASAYVTGALLQVDGGLLLSP
jgi:2-deoxy-D-gluconate 3-dehydrogenase